MANQLGYNFYTEPSQTNRGQWVGRCREFPTLSYERPNRDTALSGIRRTVEAMAKKGTLPGLAPVVLAPVAPTTLLGVAPPVVTTPDPVQPVVAAKTKINRVCFVIDRSGSMNGLENAVLKALEINIGTLREQERLHGQITLITVLEFDSSATVIRNDVPLALYRPVTYDEIKHRGGTALRDATGQAVEVLSSQHVGDEYDVTYLVNVMTDGEENQSRKYSWQQLAALLRQKIGTDVWTFTFLVPPGHSHYITDYLGVAAGNVSEWEGTEKGIQAYAAANSAGFTTYYQSRSAGVRSTKTFYTDTSKVTKAQVTANLVDIRRDVAMWDVKSTAEVRSFCESQGARPYLAGAAFYQLLKPEKVQDYKKLLVVDRTSGSVYAGDAARQLLGVPNGIGTIKLAPGNHTNYDVYVQSTSYNRKVFPGSKVIYYAKA